MSRFFHHPGIAFGFVLALASIGCPSEGIDANGAAADGGSLDVTRGPGDVDAGSGGRHQVGPASTNMRAPHEPPPADVADLCGTLDGYLDSVSERLACGKGGGGIGPFCAEGFECKFRIEAYQSCLDAQPNSAWSCDDEGHPTLGDDSPCAAQHDAFVECVDASLHTRDPFGCAAIAAAEAGFAKALGCEVDPELEPACNRYELDRHCLDDWATVVSCLDDFENDEIFECSGGYLRPKPDVCQIALSMLETCDDVRPVSSSAGSSGTGG